jgi:hypothetical protein
LGHGFLSIVLVLYLVAIGIGALGVGVLPTRTLVGDPTISLWLTTHADRIGRRHVLLAGAGLTGRGVAPLAAAERMSSSTTRPWTRRGTMDRNTCQKTA